MADRFVAFAQTSLSGKQSRIRALANNALGEVGKAIEQVADNIIKDLQDNYNTAEPGETYVRTYEMHEAWERSDAFIRGNDTVNVGITNDVTDEYGRPYAGLVQGDSRTERHFAAGWRTIDEIANDHAHEQTNRVRAAIRKAGNL